MKQEVVLFYNEPFRYFNGEKTDDESGLSHLAHLAWNALAILEIERGNNE